MDETSTAAPHALTSISQNGLLGNKSAAAPDVVLNNLIWLGKRATIMTEWERGFLFDCTGLIEQELQLSNKQVAQIKQLRVKYTGR